jgi:HAD superfamily hydrolase (TIGR01509 family)
VATRPTAAIHQKTGQIHGHTACDGVVHEGGAMKQLFPRRSRPHPVRAVLLDVDGTLVDSNDAHAAAWVAAIASQGYDVSPADVRDAIGKGGDKLLCELVGVSDESPEGEAISRERMAIFAKQHLPRLRAIPGARQLVERILGAGLRVAVASSAKEDELDGLLRIAGVEDLIPHRTSSDDAEHSKPDPDIVHAALRTLGVDAESAVLVGDTPYDVIAARTAGVRAIGVRSGGWSRRDLAGAVEVYRDVEDLASRFEESILGGRRGSVAA